MPSPAYTLSQMASDAIAVLDALGLQCAHVIGLSMGGVIAQRVAADHPQRVLCLTSIMSSSRAAGLPPPEPAAVAGMLTGMTATTRAEIIAARRQNFDLLGGPHYRSAEVGMGRLSEAAFDRASHPAGVARQMAAVIADVGRAEALAKVRAPTLVIHGDVDPLVPLACGENTARRIAGARLMIMPRMGHDLPEPLIPELLDAIVRHLRATPAR